MDWTDPQADAKVSLPISHLYPRQISKYANRTLFIASSRHYHSP